MNAALREAQTAAAQKASDYSTRRAAFPEDRERVIGLWRGNLGDPTRVESKFRWFYERSPTGEPLAILLCVADPSQGEVPQPVGVAAAGKRPFLLGDERLNAGVLVDMTVSPQHRTLFPALLLQKAMLQAGLAGSPLLYGFPNAKAAPVFQRAGYRKLGMMTRYVRVLRTAEYLRNRMPSWAATLLGSAWDLLARWRLGFDARGTSKVRLKWLDVDDAVVGPELTNVGGRPLLRGARTEAILRWRFAANAGRALGFVAVYGGEGQREHLGYWVVETVAGVLEVLDCAAVLFDGARTVGAWTALFEEARQRGLRSVSFGCLAPTEFTLALGRLGMRPRSERPVFGAVRDDHASAVAAAWYLTAADEDE